MYTSGHVERSCDLERIELAPGLMLSLSRAIVRSMLCIELIVTPIIPRTIAETLVQQFFPLPSTVGKASRWCGQNARRYLLSMVCSTRAWVATALCGQLHRSSGLVQARVLVWWRRGRSNCCCRVFVDALVTDSGAPCAGPDGV